VAARIGARPLLRELELLAERARLDLAPDPGGRRRGGRRSARAEPARARGPRPPRQGPDEPPDRRRGSSSASRPSGSTFRKSRASRTSPPALRRRDRAPDRLGSDLDPGSPIRQGARLLRRRAGVSRPSRQTPSWTSCERPPKTAGFVHGSCDALPARIHELAHCGRSSGAPTARSCLPPVQRASSSSRVRRSVPTTSRRAGRDQRSSTEAALSPGRLGHIPPLPRMRTEVIRVRSAG
jgi:hypothetical protein